MSALRRTVRPREDENRDFRPAVIEYAELMGWLVYFTQDSRGSPAGFPDLVLVRRGRLVFAELKSETGSLSRQQRLWRDVLRLVPGVEYFVWKPGDRPEIERILR